MQRQSDNLNNEKQIATGNLYYIDQLYAQYLLDKNSVEPKWQKYFETLNSTQSSQKHIDKQIYVVQLVNSYRSLGFQFAKLSPIQIRQNKFDLSQIQLHRHNLSEADLDSIFDTASFGKEEKLTLREIINKLNHIYCRHIGAEYMHIADNEQRLWIQQYLESCYPENFLNDEQRIAILDQIIRAQQLEQYIHRQFPGQKRFSLEGAEAVIACLDFIIEYAGECDSNEVIIGMAHRGRLNVMLNITGMVPQDIFDIYSGKEKSSNTYAGDVKYHLGVSATFNTKHKPVHVALGFNPSHLEIINPVVMGSTRSRQEINQDSDKSKYIPVVIHGDAAFAGQGVVMETFQLSQTRGFSVGGAIHIIINNQIGFTTSNPLDVGSSGYCSDVGKIINAPIFHVNLDDPESLIYITKLAFDFRNKFKKDVVIDCVCYRRLGHNESDEPRLTQPMMYKAIDEKPRPTELYSQQLIEQKVISEQKVKQMIADVQQILKKGEQLKKTDPSFNSSMKELWLDVLNSKDTDKVKTAISKQKIAKLTQIITSYPKEFKLHRNLEKMLEIRKQMGAGEILIDWGFAEALAFGSLLEEGYIVRLSGQDSGRGTFSHRHAVLHDQNTGNSHIPLQSINNNKAHFLVIDALLSEEAVLAFEYGYSTHNPKALVIWEAQFGDFCNVAQVVIDQFIVSGEEKWGRCSGLVLFLPHGFEGQGAEHSSARLERFLALCARKNMRVCSPSTSGQLFHMLRRQMLTKNRKPLIVMTPKSLLRKQASSSSLDILTTGNFKVIIDDHFVKDRTKIKRIVLCSGKIYYDLLNKKEELKLNQVTLIRIEELYPFPSQELRKVLKEYPNAKEVIWCQEEPENQGALSFIKYYLARHVDKDKTLYYVARPRMAAPAVGSFYLHLKQLDLILQKALTKAIPRKKITIAEAVEGDVEN